MKTLWAGFVQVIATVGDILLIGLAALVTIAMLGFFIMTNAWGHSWYDPECCSDTDCRPVAVEDVIETETGWRHLPTGTEFTKKMVKPSRDGRFHVCIGNHSWDLGKPYCIYILQGA